MRTSCRTALSVVLGVAATFGSSSMSLLIFDGDAFAQVTGHPGGNSGNKVAPSRNPNKKSAAKPPPRATADTGARSMFERAQGLYDAGKFPAALVVYDAILRKYPGHEPSTIQLAKTLYRLDRIKESYAIFARISPQGLDDETSYEYGWAFYTNKQWDGALYAFKKVSKGHALFDLANYYGAICAIKLRKYDDAQDMLEKAVVLPDKLARSRALYVKHVEALKLMQEKSSLAQDRLDEKEQLKKESEKKKPKKPDAPAAAEGPYKHTGLKSISKSAIVSFSHQRQLFDFHGTKVETYNAQITEFNLKSGPLLPLPLKVGKDRQAVLGLQLSLGAEDRLTEGTEQRLIIDESNQDLTRVLTSDPETTHSKSGLVGAAPFIEVPLPEGVWLALGGDFNFTYPEFERGGRSGNRKGYLGLGGQVASFKFQTEVSYSEILDQNTKPTTDTAGGTIKGTLTLPAKLDLSGEINHTQFDYLSEAIDGPDSSSSFELGATQSLPLGFAIGVGGVYEYQANNVVHNIPSYGQLAADGQIMTGKLSLSADPFPWLSASVEQIFVKSKWKQDNEDAHDAFEANVVDYLEQLTASVGINMAF